MPSNFRNFTALTQLIPGMTPNPAASTFEGGQVVANGTPSQQNVYLIDGMYNNDDRLGGSQGTQVRVVLDNIEEYQVLSNQFSAEYGGGAGAIINMVTRGGTNNFNGRAYTYFRDDKFNARGHFLPPTAAKPDERTLQAGFGLGGPIVKDRAHFYFTVREGQRGHRRPEALPGRGGAAGAGHDRRLHVQGDELLRARRPAAEREELLQRPLGARDRADAWRGLQHQQPDARRPDMGERLGSPDQRQLHHRRRRSRQQRDPRRPHRRGTGHRRPGVLRRRRQLHRLRRARSVFDRAVERPSELRHRQGRFDGPDAHPHLRVRRLVQLLRAEPVGRRAHLQDGRRHQLQPDAAADDGRFRHLPCSGPMRPTTRPTRRLTRSSSTSSSGRRTSKATMSSPRIAATTFSSRTSTGSATT